MTIDVVPVGTCGFRGARKQERRKRMIWMIGCVFIGGFLVGVVFMALLCVARDPESRPSLPDEAETGYLQRRLAPEAVRD